MTASTSKRTLLLSSSNAFHFSSMQHADCDVDGSGGSSGGVRIL